ncbi:MAG: hypothetical protein ABSA43_01090 [Candidatus Microgenomates bacterium]|jgi:hypothetical protein
MKENLNLIFCVILLVGFVYLFLRIDNIKIPEGNNVTNTVNQYVCGPDCKDEIDKSVSQAMATVSAGTKTVVEKEITGPTPAKQNQVAYIPVAGPITTTATDWVDAVGTDFYLDLSGDYNSKATASWEAFLSVANNNGQAFARLFDETHGIAVNGSEISLTDTAASTRVASGNVSLWQGRNLYRVQIKSLNSFLVTFGSGRVKINY